MSSKRESILPLFKPRESNKTDDRRLARLSFIPNWVRNEAIAFIGEFVGTFMFLFMAFAATQVANASAPETGEQTDSHSLTRTPNTSNLLYISLAFGFSLAINVWAFFRISGGLFNPAVRATTIDTPFTRSLF
jgi:aquaporin rerated protein, other eukaryote